MKVDGKRTRRKQGQLSRECKYEINVSAGILKLLLQRFVHRQLVCVYSIDSLGCNSIDWLLSPLMLLAKKCEGSSAWNGTMS